MSMGSSPQSEAPVYTCLLGVTLLLEQFEYANSENLCEQRKRLFKYIENFTTKEGTFSEKKNPIFFIFLLET